VLQIRPIQADDKDRLASGLDRLSAETIRKRFLAAKPRFTTRELSYLTEIDGRNHIALVALDDDNLVAVARCVRLPDQPEVAEMAIVVADPYQGRGLGTRLAEELAERAREQGIRRFAGTMLPDNLAALALMGRIARAFEDDHLEHGLREVVVSLTT
jgi:GNAT superfamily N-acetyltransferase